MGTGGKDAPVQIDKLVERYIALRDKKAALKAQYDESVAPIDEMLERCEAILLGQMQTTGADSFKTKYGTAYSKERVTYGTDDWLRTLQWIVDQQAWGMLEKRVSKSFLDSHVEETGELPPGVNCRREIVVNVMRGKAK